MNIDNMTRKIWLIKMIESSNRFGDVIKTPSVVAAAWAEVLPVTESEQRDDGKTIARRSSRFRIWFRDDLTAKHKILYNGEYYDISGIRELGYREAIELTAGVSDG